MGRRKEVFSAGIDEFLEGIGGDPFGGITVDGLRVPTHPTAVPVAGGPVPRYLFNLCSFNIAPNTVARIRGYRQLASIGARQTVAGTIVFTEFPIVTPTWRFQDGNISWHLMMLPPGTPAKKGEPGPLDLANFAFQMSDTPALLYQAVTTGGDPNYPNLLTYTPPNQGRPWGRPAKEGLGNFYSFHANWTSDHAWTSLDIPIVGPMTVAFFASIKQTNPETRHAITAPAGGGAFTFSEGLAPEDQFLQNFPTAVYWRVGGALVFELTHYADFDAPAISCSGTANVEAIR